MVGRARKETGLDALSRAVGDAIGRERVINRRALDLRDRRISDLKGRVARLEKLLMEKGIQADERSATDRRLKAVS